MVIDIKQFLKGIFVNLIVKVTYLITNEQIQSTKLKTINESITNLKN